MSPANTSSAQYLAFMPLSGVLLRPPTCQRASPMARHSSTLGIALDTIAVAERGVAFRRRAVATPARKPDFDDVLGLQHTLRLRGVVAAPVDEHLTGSARSSAEESLGRNAGTIAQHRADVRLGRPHAELDHLAEPASIAAVAARTVA